MNRGKRIRERRKALKMSAEELGKKIGRDRATVYRYEGEYVEKIDIDVLRSIADALQTSVQYLTGETDDPDDPWYKPLHYEPPVLTPEEEDMINKLRALDEDQRRHFIEVVDIAFSVLMRKIEEDSEDAGV